jgi:polysaccharide export outer membrane protein
VSLPDHKILPNDLLSVVVYDEPELSRSVRVDPDGKIAMPQLTEKLQAAGTMPRDIEKEISNALVDGQILLHPIVAVSILEYAERSISVVGDVKMPGQFRIAGPVSLLEALAKAGWVTNAAGPDVLLTTPDSPTPRKIGLRDLQMSTDRSLNVMLTGGETISVPDAKQELIARFPKGPKVWVTGNISHPLVYSITNPADATVLKIMTSADGEAQYAKTAWIYRRDGEDNRQSIPIALSDIMHRKAQDVTLQADDILFVPDTDTKKMQEYYDTHPLTPPWEIAK